jgi:hypothetical protein
MNNKKSKGRRDQDRTLFSQPNNDHSIVPDRVSPAVEGYFRIPAIWVGEAPAPAEAAILNPRIHHAVVFQKKLKCGITVRAQRDGMFLFNFSEWSLAPITIIPGYKRQEGDSPHIAPQEHTNAENIAEERAVFRAQVMNVHQHA